MDRPHDDHPDDDHPDDDLADRPPMPTQAALEAMLDAGEADAATGQTVPAEPVLARMRATAERIRRERALREATLPWRA